MVYGPLWLLEIAVQIFFAVHAFRSGRFGWAFLVIAFPVVGSAAYFFVEFLPEFRRGPVVRGFGSGMIGRLDSMGAVRRLKEQLEIADTIANRTALADAYVATRHPELAVPLYESCLSGAYAGDPVALAGLSTAYFAMADYEKARTYLEQLRATRQQRPTHEFDLLYARAIEGLGRTHEALGLYESLVPVATGEEARYRYAALLKKLGRTGDAVGVLREVLRNARLSPSYYRRSERAWISAAKRELRGLS